MILKQVVVVVVVVVLCCLNSYEIPFNCCLLSLSSRNYAHQFFNRKSIVVSNNDRARSRKLDVCSWRVTICLELVVNQTIKRTLGNSTEYSEKVCVEALLLKHDESSRVH